ncbi:MAG TPA: hypothetical protein VM677_03695 [Actinokineospora sp.]|jgi:hypothetical protein|nr:hypothetical protein [Actinokineospora sp.]
MTTVTREQAITAAGRILALARAERDSLPPRLAAEAAHYAGGPSVDEIERQIREMRGLPTADAA